MKGRLIVTGIGKSAIVGQKIVATLNSTGTASLFMHAADAIHGDLGMLQENDIVLCISKSGETSEIKVLIPLIKRLGNRIIAMTTNKSSYLSVHSDYALVSTMKKEADPNNLAPTTSTTIQMVLGDAIAISLLKLRGFTQADFAKYHPGGSLGKQLYLKVGDITTNNEKPQVAGDTDIRKIIIEISSKLLGATAVINDNKLLGIITDGDLRRMLEREEDVSQLKAIDIMGTNPYTIQVNEFAVNALEMMRNNNISQLIVVDSEGSYAGMIHLHDLIREGIV